MSRSMDEPATLTIVAAGDCFSDLPDGTNPFAHLTPLLVSADIAYGNCEGVYTDRPSLAPSRMVFHGAPLERGAPLVNAGFSAMTFASNHALDAGDVGLTDTLDYLRAHGISTTGAGSNLAEALQPAIVERKGRRVAFLGYCSAFPRGHEARPDRPGVAPLRVSTLYRDPLPNFWDPGLEPEVITHPDPGDLHAYRTAIDDARASADIVVVSCHWGYAGMVRDRVVPRSSTHHRTWIDGVQDYEIELARDAIDHGADAVVCHHQLSLRGVQFHRGKPIFHGLGVLVNHFHGRPDVVAERDGADQYPYFPFDPIARMTGLAVLSFAPTGTLDAGFIPARIQPDGSTIPCAAGDDDAKSVIDHLLGLTAAHGFSVSHEITTWRGWTLLRLFPSEHEECVAR